jgi:hypothetical protein
MTVPQPPDPPLGLDWRTATRAALGEEIQRLRIELKDANAELSTRKGWITRSVNERGQLHAEIERQRSALRGAVEHVTAIIEERDAALARVAESETGAAWAERFRLATGAVSCEQAYEWTSEIGGKLGAIENGRDAALARVAELETDNERLRLVEKTALDQLATERTASRTAHQEIDALRAELADRNRSTADTEWRERIAALLQARLSWRQAEGCADDVIHYAIAPLLARVAELSEERDAYGDTLARIAESDLDEDVLNVSAAIVAKMVLDQRGYLPFGRLRNAEAEIERLEARVAELEAQRAAVLALCDEAESEALDDQPMPKVSSCELRVALAAPPDPTHHDNPPAAGETGGT